MQRATVLIPLRLPATAPPVACADLAGKLTSLSHTSIASVTTVAAGTLKLAAVDVAELTPVGKSVIQMACGRAPDLCYFGGCSNGGRHTLVTAARLADQYDDYLAGTPDFNLAKATIANIFGAQRLATVATRPSCRK